MRETCHFGVNDCFRERVGSVAKIAMQRERLIETINIIACVKRGDIFSANATNC